MPLLSLQKKEPALNMYGLSTSAAPCQLLWNLLSFPKQLYVASLNSVLLTILDLWQSRLAFLLCSRGSLPALVMIS